MAAWAEKIEGAGASREVLDALGQLHFQLNFGGGEGGGRADGGMLL